jgi:hypothetical protein
LGCEVQMLVIVSQRRGGVELTKRANLFFGTLEVFMPEALATLAADRTEAQQGLSN